MDSDSESDTYTIPLKRGVKYGIKRGKYNPSNRDNEKNRIIAEALRDGDWKSVARANGVSIGKNN